MHSTKSRTCAGFSVLLLLLCLANTLPAQTVVVGGRPFTAGEREVLQLLTGIELKGDTNYQREALYKGYLLSHLFAKSINGDSLLKTNPGLQRSLVLQQQVARNKFLGSKYQSAPAPADVMKFYDANYMQFGEPARLSAVIATLDDTSAAVKKEVRGILAKYKATGAQAADFPKSYNDQYNIRGEGSIDAVPGGYLYDFILLPGLTNDTVVEHRQANGQQYVILVKQISKPAKLPYATVKQKVDSVYALVSRNWVEQQVLASPQYRISFNANFYDPADVKETAAFGTIGKDSINTELMDAIQSVSPDFFFSKDSLGFTKRLLEYYMLPAYYASKVTDTVAYKNELRLSDDIVKSGLLYRYFYAQVFKASATDAAIEEYYKQHIEDYTVYGQCSYLVAVLFDTSATAVKAAKAELQKKADSPFDINNVKLDNTAFSISYENLYPFGQDKEADDILMKLPWKKVSEPFYFRRYGTKVIVAILTRTGNKPRPLAEVKDSINSILTARQLITAEQQYRVNAFKLIRFE